MKSKSNIYEKLDTLSKENLWLKQEIKDMDEEYRLVFELLPFQTCKIRHEKGKYLVSFAAGKKFDQIPLRKDGQKKDLSELLPYSVWKKFELELQTAFSGLTTDFAVHSDDKWFDVLAYPFAYNWQEKVVEVLVLIRDFTDFHATENELSSFQQQLEKIMESTSDLIYIMAGDNDGFKMNYCNPFFEHLIKQIDPEFDLNKLKGITMDELGEILQWKQEFTQHITCTLSEVMLTGETIHREEEIPSPRGIYYFDAYYTPIFDIHKQCRNVMVKYYNITEYVRLQDKLRKNLDRLKLALDAAGNGMFDWDMQKNEIYYSAAFRRIIGYWEDEIPDNILVWEQLLDSDSYKRWEEMQQKQIHQKKERYEIELQLEHKSGRLLNLLMREKIIYDRAGNAVRMVGTQTDVTDLKKAEIDFRATADRMRMIFDNSPISIWEEEFGAVMDRLSELKTKGVTDFKNYFVQHPEEIPKLASMVQVLDVNRATLDMFKAKTKDDLLGNLGKTFTLNSYEKFKEVLIFLADDRKEFKTEGEVKTLTGEVLYVDLRYNRSFNVKSSEYSHIALISIIDITEKKKFEQELEVHRSHLEDLVQKRTFELKEKNEELEKFNKLFIGREHRIKELKQKLHKYENANE